VSWEPSVLPEGSAEVVILAFSGREFADFQEYFEGSWQPRVIHGAESLTQGEAAADEGLGIDVPICKMPQRRWKWSASRTDHRDLIHYHGRHVEIESPGVGTLDDQNSAGAQRPASDVESLRLAGTFDHNIEVPVRKLVSQDSWQNLGAGETEIPSLSDLLQRCRQTRAQGLR